MTAVQRNLSNSLLAADESAGPQRRSSSPNPLYRSCPAFDVRRPLCEGYLFKQSHLNEMVFNKRYFALYPDLLVYYKSQADCEHDKEKNRLTVSGCTRARLTPARLVPSVLYVPTEAKANGVPPCGAVFDEAGEEAEGLQVLLDPSRSGPQEPQKVGDQPGCTHARTLGAL